MHDIAPLLFSLLTVLAAAKLLGAAMQRLGQPAVLGELLAGVLLGGSLLNVLHPQEPAMHALADLGVLILLFEIGLHTSVRSLLRVGGTASMVASVGVALPFGLGYLAATLLGVDELPAIVCGAALTATSIGISARVLTDLGQLQSREGQVVLGAAVLDDIIGLIILSVVSGLATGGGVTLLGVARVSGIAVGFTVAAIGLGALIAAPLFRGVNALDRSGALLGPLALAFALLLGWLADQSGTAVIIGAFAAGMALNDTPQREAIEASIGSLGEFFVPVFFAVVGASVDVASLLNGPVLLIGAALIVVAVAGKVAAGFAPWWFRGNKLAVGVAMVPRGEVGLIFAQVGLTTAVLSVQLFSALTLMVMVTTFLAPAWLSRLSWSSRNAPRPS